MADEVTQDHTRQTVEPDVLIRRGVPSMPGIPRDTCPGKYPYEAIRVVKLLREHDLVVEYEDDRANREYFTHDAFDIWMPVMQFAVTVGGGVTVAVLTDMIKKLTKRSQDNGAQDRPATTVLHLEITMTDPKGTQRQLKLDGTPDDIFEALDRLQFDGGDDSGQQQLPRA